MMLYLSLSLSLLAFTRSHTDAISRTNTNTTYTHWQREGWWNIFDFFFCQLCPRTWHFLENDFEALAKPGNGSERFPGANIGVHGSWLLFCSKWMRKNYATEKKRTTRRKITFPLLWHSGQLTHIWAESRFKCLACGSALVRQSAVSAVLSCHRSGCHSYFMLTTPSPRNSSKKERSRWFMLRGIVRARAACWKEHKQNILWKMRRLGDSGVEWKQIPFCSFCFYFDFPSKHKTIH